MNVALSDYAIKRSCHLQVLLDGSLGTKCLPGCIDIFFASFHVRTICFDGFLGNYEIVACHYTWCLCGLLQVIAGCFIGCELRLCCAKLRLGVLELGLALCTACIEFGSCEASQDLSLVNLGTSVYANPLHESSFF